MICFCASSSELCASHELHFTFRVQCFRLKKTFSRNGTNRARTYDPLLVRQMLSQLSYDPICSSVSQPTSLLYNHLLTNVNCFFHFFALFFPETANTTCIIQRFCTNQKISGFLRRFSDYILHRGYVLYNSLSLHCIYNFFKSGNVSTYYIVSFCSVTFCCVCCVMADIYHDVLKFCINFFECPAETFAVL